MPKRITITPHLGVDELAQRYRQAQSPIERSHYQIIWLLAQGKRSEEVVEVTGYSRNWIYELVRDYNVNGSQCLGDGRRENPGATPLLTEVQQALLLQVLRGEDYGMGAKWPTISVNSSINPSVANKAGSTCASWNGVCGCLGLSIKTPTPTLRTPGEKTPGRRRAHSADPSRRRRRGVV